MRFPAVAFLIGSLAGPMFGSVRFLPTVTRPTGITRPASLAIADVNGSFPDIVIGHGYGGVSALLRLSDGTFSEPIPIAVPSSADGVGTAMHIADLDRDDRNDVVYTNESRSTVSVLFGTVTGGWQVRQDPIKTPHSPTSVRVTLDVTGDGLRDVVVTESADPLLVLQGEGGGHLQPIGLPASVGAVQRGVSLDDLDGDGRLDLILATAAAHGFAVIPGVSPGRGFFGTLVRYDRRDVVNTWQSTSIALGRTGGQKFVVASGRGTATPEDVFVARQKSGFVFEEFQLPGVIGLGPMTVHVADFDQDHRDEIVVADAIARRIDVVAFDGSAFSRVATFSFATNLAAMATGDLNADGVPDITAIDSTGTLHLIVTDTRLPPRRRSVRH